MPKATLEFNLPEEEFEHRMAINSRSYYSVLFAMDQYLRNHIKHSEIWPHAQAIRDKLYELLSDYEVSLVD